jgi:uncharacterized protein (DUF952 family)
MEPIFHITSAHEADRATGSGTYVPEAFHVDGFVHCSYRHQLVEVANRHFAGRTGLVLMEIDRGKLACKVVDENLEGGAELYPHVYGPLPMAAVVGIHEFP